MPVVWRSIMKTKTKWIKECRDCGEPQYYKKEFLLNRALKLNTRCSGCRVFTNEHKQNLKMSRAKQTPVKHTDDTKRRLSESHKGKRHSNETKSKQRIAAINRISKAKFNGGQMIPNYNPSSILFIEQKAKELGITDLQHAENGGEYHIKELGYWVDGYSKEKNIVIEYDERKHLRTDMLKKDQRRQKEITEHLNCKFIRISE